jgi:predicted nuclease of predicted toxin-antitoxin system
MSERFLIDECLSVELVSVAHAEGFEAYHVAHYGFAGKKDPSVFARVQQEGFVFVTNNRDDFVDLAGRVDLHAGLVVILPQARREAQKVLFAAVLRHIVELGSIINRVIEIDANGVIDTFGLPPEADR